MEEDAVCSEVHTFTEANFGDGGNVARFRFTVPEWLTGNQSPLSKEPEYDSDGDVIVSRRDELKEETLLIEHDLSTPLAGVGRQIWKGSLLLADYLLNNPELVDCKILELGSGTGLTSIICAFCGARITASDIDDQGILEKIRANILRNKNLAKTNVKVMPVNLKVDRYTDLSERFELILAGDLIYDDDLTDAFVKFVVDAFQVNRDLTVLVAVEKRYVFTVKDLDTVAPAFDHFVQQLASVDHSHGLNITYIPTDFKQCFCYERGKDMVLMKINIRN